MAFDTTHSFDTTQGLDPELLSQLLGTHVDMADCARMGRNFLQALLIAPKRTTQEKRAAEHLTTLLGVLLPVLEPVSYTHLTLPTICSV